MENGSLASIIKPSKFGAFPESLVAVYIAQVGTSAYSIIFNVMHALFTVTVSLWSGKACIFIDILYFLVRLICSGVED